MIAAVGATSAALTAPATLSADALYAVATLTGAQTAALHDAFAARACIYAIVEAIGDAQVTRGAGSLRVTASAATPSATDPVTIDLPYVTAMPTPDAVLITQTGARGLSAAEQFAIGGLDPEEPQAAAMFAALSAGSAEPAIAATQAIRDEAREAADDAAAASLDAEGFRDTAGGHAGVAAENSAATLADRTAVAENLLAVQAIETSVIEAAASTIVAAENVEQSAAAIIGAGIDIVSVQPLAAEVRLNAELARTYAAAAMAPSFYDDLFDSIGGAVLTGPQHIYGDAQNNFVVRTGLIAENGAAISAAASAASTALATANDLLTADSYYTDLFDSLAGATITSPRFIKADANGHMVFMSQDPPADIGEIAAAVGEALPIVYTDLFERDGPATLFVDGAGNIIAASEAGASSARAATFGSGDVGSYRDATTGCAISKLHFRTATRPQLLLAVGIGQSLWISSGDAVYTDTATYPDDILMLNGSQGVRCINNRPFTETGLTDAVEQFESIYAESGMVAMLNRIAKRVTDAVGHTPLMGGIVGGTGGTAIRNLRRGTLAYEPMLYAVQRFRDFADALGYDVIVPWLIICEGNEDTPITSGPSYARAMLNFRREFSEDMKRLLGAQQPDQVVMYLDQPDTGSNAFPPPSAPTVPTEIGVLIGAVEAAQRDPFIRLIGAHGDIVKADGTHPPSLGYVFMRERWAELIFKDYFCGGQPDFVITKAWRKAGNKIGLYIQVPFPPLVIDLADTLMPASQLVGKGFIFYDGSGSPPTNSAPAITAVTVIADGSSGLTPQAELEITLASAPTGPAWQLFHAMQRMTSVWNNGMMTCIRDSSPALSTMDVDGNPASGGNGRPLYNFMNPQVIYL